MLRKISGEFGVRNLNLKFVKQRSLVVGLNMPLMWSTGWLAFIYTLVRPYVLLYNVDLYLALFSMRPRVLRSYMGVSRARLGFIYTVVRGSGPIGRHCVFSALWGVPQCAGSAENNKKQSTPNRSKSNQNSTNYRYLITTNSFQFRVVCHLRNWL